MPKIVKLSLEEGGEYEVAICLTGDEAVRLMHVTGNFSGRGKEEPYTNLLYGIYYGLDDSGVNPNALEDIIGLANTYEIPLKD
jgi:hypothetical protein